MRILVVRLGGFGDCLIVTPLIRWLAQQGHVVTVLTQDQGRDVIFPNNPYITELRYHVPKSVSEASLLDYLAAYRDREGFDEMVQLNESLEVRLALHPEDPAYSWSKPERMARCNRSYYQEPFRMAVEQIRDTGLRTQLAAALETTDPVALYAPDMFFTSEERDALQDFRTLRLTAGAVLVWALAGSGTHKSYPWTDYVLLDLLERYEDLLAVTVGGPEARILELGSKHPRLLRQAGQWTFRQTALVAREFCDVVVAPDTGLLHAAGGGLAATVGLFGHCTIEQATQYFPRDCSVEAQVSCAPCCRLVYDIAVQCPVDPVTTGAWCMSQGLSHERVLDAIERALALSLVPS